MFPPGIESEFSFFSYNFWRHRPLENSKCSSRRTAHGLTPGGQCQSKWMLEAAVASREILEEVGCLLMITPSPKQGCHWALISHSNSPIFLNLFFFFLLSTGLMLNWCSNNFFFSSYPHFLHIFYEIFQKREWEEKERGGGTSRWREKLWMVDHSWDNICVDLGKCSEAFAYWHDHQPESFVSPHTEPYSLMKMMTTKRIKVTSGKRRKGED